MAKEKAIARIERESGRTFEEALRSCAVDRLTPEQVAGELECTMQTLMKYAKELGFKVVRRLEKCER